MRVFYLCRVGVLWTPWSIFMQRDLWKIWVSCKETMQKLRSEVLALLLWKAVIAVADEVDATITKSSDLLKSPLIKFRERLVVNMENPATVQKFEFSFFFPTKRPFCSKWSFMKCKILEITFLSIKMAIVMELTKDIM